jgi:hypothetical protein
MRNKLYSLIKNVFKGKIYFYITIFFLFIFIFIKISNWQTYNVLSTDSRHEWRNRENYLFYKECRKQFKYYHKSKKYFNALNNLVRNEPNLHTFVDFKIRHMPFRSLVLGDAYYIINDYESENWFVKKNFHSKSTNENIQYLDLLKKYKFEDGQIFEIDNTMKELGIEVVNRFDGYIELCWESPISDNSLDWYDGYLIVDNIEVVSMVKLNYRYISQIDDNCFYFWRDIEK